VTTDSVPVRRSVRLDYFELTKPRITFMVTLTCLVGFVMASPGGIAPLPLLAAIAGTALVAAGSAVFNMLMEMRTDALMRRTRERPLPAGRLRPVQALAFGTLLTVAGLLTLAFGAGRLAAAVAFVTWCSYLLVYTPLKTRTSLATLVGAVPGALPPVIGWAAARNALEPGAFILFAILFLWQIPHFLAIAWIFQEDYERGGLPMLPVVDPAGRMTGRQALANTIALLVVSLAPTAAGLAGPLYALGAALLGTAYTIAAARAAARRDLASARRLFFVSILYLPILSALMILDRTGGPLSGLAG
jgi:protoheme IX farnesyltransferase